MPNKRVAWGQTIFCDDLRLELGNKLSLMGLYQGDLLINADFPLLLPKFVIFTAYYELRGALKENLKLEIYMPHDTTTPSLSTEIPREIKVEYPEPPDGDSEPIYYVQSPMVLSPFEIRQEGYIRVRMVCGDTTTRLGRLHIRKPKENEIIFPNV